MYGFLHTVQIDPADFLGWYIPGDVTDLRGFLCAGYMHNSAYLGGILAIFVAWAFHILVRVKTKVERLPKPVPFPGTTAG